MCEVYAWVCFAIAVQTLAVFIFIAAGTGQMIIWAQGKHRRLRKVRSNGPASLGSVCAPVLSELAGIWRYQILTSILLQDVDV